MLKLLLLPLIKRLLRQPPLGGCVLKLDSIRIYYGIYYGQPPLGGCVLKLVQVLFLNLEVNQPPLGGCVLKLSNTSNNLVIT